MSSAFTLEKLDDKISILYFDLPNEKVKITSLRLAETKPNEVEEVLKREVSQRFAMDPDKDSISYMPVGSVRQGDDVRNELILFAADNETIKSHIAINAYCIA